MSESDLRRAAAQKLLSDAIAGARELAPSAQKEVLRLLASQELVCGSEEGIETAAVRLRGGRTELFVSPDFLREHLLSPESALWVMAHELLHPALGDLHRESGRSPQLQNFLCDLVVNAQVARLLGTRGAEVPARLYSPHRFPEQLLLTPAQLFRAFAELGVHGAADGDRPVEEVARILSEDPPRALRLRRALHRGFDLTGCPDPALVLDVYLRVWIDLVPEETIAEELLPLLLEHFPSFEQRVAGLPFIGGHEYASYRPRMTATGTGGLEDLLEEDITTVERPSAAAREAFLLSVLEALDVDPTRLSVPEDVVIATPLLGRSRRDLALLGAGVVPPLFHDRPPVPSSPTEQAHVYVDVSGSTSDVVGLLYGLVALAEDVLAQPVYTFSNRVVPLTPQAVREGRVQSTWGTDFDCLLEHALQHRYRKILIVTDGLASASPPLVRAAHAAGMRLVALLVGEAHSRVSLAAMGARVLELPWSS